MQPAELAVGTRMDYVMSDAISHATSRTEPLARRDTEAGSHVSQIQQSSFLHGKEELILAQGAAVVEAEETAAMQAEQGAIESLNGFADYVERKQQQRDHEIQLSLQMADAVEDDAHAVARSLTTLLSSLKSALSEVTTSSVANMRIENEAAGQVQDAAIDAASKGNRFINTCLRLNEEMKGMERVASQLEALKEKVDHVERQASRFISR